MLHLIFPTPLSNSYSTILLRAANPKEELPFSFILPFLFPAAAFVLRAEYMKEDLPFIFSASHPHTCYSFCVACNKTER
jgi:hypothetical protein